MRATLAQFYDPERFRSSTGQVDYAKMIAAASTVRDKYRGNPLICATSSSFLLTE